MKTYTIDTLVFKNNYEIRECDADTQEEGILIAKIEEGCLLTYEIFKLKNIQEVAKEVIFSEHRKPAEWRDFNNFEMTCLAVLNIDSGRFMQSFQGSWEEFFECPAAYCDEDLEVIKQNKMGAPRRRKETKPSSMRMEVELIEFFKSISPNVEKRRCVDGVHLIGNAAMTWQDLPALTIKESHFVCDTLNGYWPLEQDPILIKYELEDALEFGQGSMFDIESNFVDEVKSWTVEECEAIKNAASAFWAMVHIDEQQSANQFFKIK